MKTAVDYIEPQQTFYAEGNGFFNESDSLQTKECEKKYCNILKSICDEFEDFVIISKEGILEKIFSNFEEMYGISAEEAIGKSLYELEAKKIFNPSIAIRTLKSLKHETQLQYTRTGKCLMCTATPVFDEQGNLERVISYTRDVTKYERMKDEYDALQNMIASYATQLGQLRQERERNTKTIGNSQEFKKIMSVIDKVSKFDANILLTGESGVGKTLFAETIHAQSQRKDSPFITINCGAIPENLLESELFGYERGAFSGASQEGKPGLIELAHKGILFLDEIGDMPLHMQVKLLKVIQDKKVTRIGGLKEKQVDFRLITASNKDLEKLAEENKFRKDLYYRLNVILINIPSLRDRGEDIIFLINHFLKKFNEIHKVNHIFSYKAMSLLESYSWPGNIRELENLVERMVITTDDYMITEDMMPQYIYNSELIENRDIHDKTLKEIMENVEKRVFVECYKKYKTTTKIAQILGISQSSASIKLIKYLDNRSSE